MQKTQSNARQGGSYSRDPKTGKLTLVNQTKQADQATKSAKDQATKKEAN
jgi:hypothetical protein